MKWSPSVNISGQQDSGSELVDEGVWNRVGVDSDTYRRFYGTCMHAYLEESGIRKILFVTISTHTFIE